MNTASDYYRELVKSAPMAYALHRLVVDDSGEPVDYVFLDVNSAFEKMTGLTHEQVINKPISEAIPGIKEGEFDWIEYYGNLTLKGKESTFVQYSEPLGRWYRVHAYSPKSMHFVTLFFDISRDKQQQEELNQIKQQLASVVNTQKELICRFTPDTTLTFVNEAYCRTFGKAADELLGKSFIDLLPQEEKEEVRKKVKSIKKLKRPLTYKHRVITADNEIRWQEWTDYPIFDQRGALSEIQSVGYDITARQEAEQKLQAREKMYRSLFEQTNDAVTLLDLHGNHIEANERAAEMLGYKHKDFIQLSYKDVSAETEKSDKTLERLLDGKKIKPFERRFKKKDGTIIDVEVNVELVRGEDGEPTHIQSVARDITARKTREAEHQEIFDQYNIILESTQDAIFLVEVTSVGGFRYMRNNKTHQKLTGISQEQFAGKTPEELVGKELAGWITSNYWRCVKKKKPINYEETLELSGRTRTYLTRLSPVLSKGKVGYIVGSSNDITERNRAEQQLQRKDAMQQMLMKLATELINVPVQEVDSQVNRMLASIGKSTGLDRVYVFQHDYQQEITTNTHEWCAKGIRPEIDNLQVTPFSFFADWLEKHDRGEEIYIPKVSEMPQAQPMKAVLEAQNIQSLLLIPMTCQGRNMGFVGFDSVRHERVFEEDEISLLRILALMICNLEDRRANQIKLQKSEQRYKMLVENLNEIIYTLDNHAVITYISPNIEQMSGFTWNEVIGKQFIDFVHPEDLNDRIAQFKKVLSGVSEPSEYRFLKKDGSSVWIRTNARPIIEGGKLKGIQGALTEITDLKQYQQDLIEAKERALESDRFKSAFLANMSHEIRTPMNGILGFTELLKESQHQPEEQQEFIGIIEKSGHRMLNLINDIIDISKIESGQMPVSVSSVNINQEMEALHAFFLPRFQKDAGDLELHLDIPEEEYILSTDQGKFQSIMTNLLSNALKFTNAGAVTMGFGEKDGQLEFFVRDTGLGIKQEKLDSLFDRFFQADPLDTNNKEGAGLGLAITKAFVELLGGKIWVHSEYGSGSVFHFTLPITEKHGQSGTEEHSPMQQDDQNDAQSNQQNKILLVEDDLISARLIKQYLADQPYRVTHVETAEDAIKVIKKQANPDIVLMDIKLPGMNGLDAIKKIREMGFSKPIIAQSAYAIRGDEKAALQAGSNAYLTKPLSKKRLLDCLDEYIRFG